MVEIGACGKWPYWEDCKWFTTAPTKAMNYLLVVLGEALWWIARFGPNHERILIGGVSSALLCLSFLCWPWFSTTGFDTNVYFRYTQPQPHAHTQPHTAHTFLDMILRHFWIRRIVYYYYIHFIVWVIVFVLTYFIVWGIAFVLTYLKHYFSLLSGSVNRRDIARCTHKNKQQIDRILPYIFFLLTDFSFR